MWQFFEGQQVVCVTALRLPEARNEYLERLQEGSIYTVRDIVKNASFQLPGYGILLEEVSLPQCEIVGAEVAWHPLRFRPCAKTDISVFTQMLEDIPEGVDA